jgi:hypothetical protein
LFVVFHIHYTFLSVLLVCYVLSFDKSDFIQGSVFWMIAGSIRLVPVGSAITVLFQSIRPLGKIELF